MISCFVWFLSNIRMKNKKHLNDIDLEIKLMSYDNLHMYTIVGAN